MSDDLNELERIAREATAGPWEAKLAHWGEADVVRLLHEEEPHETPLLFINGKPAREIVPYIRLADATFIATFDPPFVLELLSKCRALEGENVRLNDRNVEVSVLAHGWMVAHDKFVAGEPYEFPSPADVPAILARAEAAEARLREVEGAIERTTADVTDLLTDAKTRCNQIAAVRRAIGPVATQAQTAAHSIAAALRALAALGVGGDGSSASATEHTSADALTDTQSSTGKED